MAQAGYPSHRARSEHFRQASPKSEPLQGLSELSVRIIAAKTVVVYVRPELGL